MVTRRGFLSGMGGVMGSAVAGLAAPPLRTGAGPSPAGPASDTPGPPIDRKALVSRHDVVRTASNPASPLQVGNGRFAFGADITGLQTFVPFAIMSDWGWHNDPLPPGQTPGDFQGEVWDTHGRPVRYSMPDPAHPAISQWLIADPNRMNLARIGLQLQRADGSEPSETDLAGRQQRLDLWTGILRSQFTLDGVPVTVETSCAPAGWQQAPAGAIGVRIASPLISSGRLGVFLDFPYNNGKQKFQAPYVGVWDQPGAHVTTLRTGGPGLAGITHQLDDTTYHVSLDWHPSGTVAPVPGQPHRYLLTCPGAGTIDLSCSFAPGPDPGAPSDGGDGPLPAAAVAAASAQWWPAFWRSGGAIDLSGSTDPRAAELERRIVLSQYLEAVNESGETPPQESGLVNDGWYGKFHMEMYWWHCAHQALWNRWELLDRSLGVYRSFLPSSRQRAADQGYQGARWPKMTDPDGRMAPGEINALLIWQQPHPIMFAELDYRAHPSRATLLKWQEIIEATADFMASYAFYDTSSGRYVLGPPLYPVSENTDPVTTTNPTLELSYWRTGLRLAQQWRTRLGLATVPQWDQVLNGLAALPVQDGVYVLTEGIENMWTRYNTDHPGLTGALGWLPGDGVDPATMAATAQKVRASWDFTTCWGWDFPMLAMNAARIGDPGTAIGYLMHPEFQFDDAGMPGGGTKVPLPYFPGSGGLLYAAAFLAAGWDGAPGRAAPGFPDDGTWTVRSDGLARAI